MKSLRIICGALGGIHYSSTPDLALDTCPVCGEACREIEVEDEVKKTLLELLYEADAVQIDDHFIRHFHMEQEECEDGEDTVLSAEFVEDFVNYELMFTLDELTTAVKYDKIDGYKVTCGNTDSDIYQIVPYKLAELKA